MKLTRREAECVTKFAEGHSYATAGRSLDISHRTVRYHMENAKKKLCAMTNTHLVVLAIKHEEIAIP